MSRLNGLGATGANAGYPVDYEAKMEREWKNINENAIVKL
mgnify:CR=1 FL=1|jgi:hypothetical protein